MIHLFPVPSVVLNNVQQYFQKNISIRGRCLVIGVTEEQHNIFQLIINEIFGNHEIRRLCCKSLVIVLMRKKKLK